MNFCHAPRLLDQAGKGLFPTISRSFAGEFRGRKYKQRTALYYALSFGICMLGVGYAGVPLYRMYCSQKGVGTNSEFARAKSLLIRNMNPIKDRQITVYFSADTHSRMAWNFKPVQSSLTVVPGETALAFYSAENPSETPITGIATYSVLPTDAAKYFNKIQCFCFEEQRLNPHEKVDMPVFFFLDPEFAEDPRLMLTNHIILHYTFFEAKKTKMHIPGISTPVPQT
ncbi:Cytochrome c oxidase assembly protein subunit 11 [Fasciola hepatica]|uniref:Cytochrome c oxidase assembly protein COX11, mitochondrial n=1 Tax=Fasciola hepatica TaxID=6192 RepID=A0A4E0R2E7_FASHE|nr:Cytochrome c oxidase assembly protein subunit 11 [Fasciola hepatica]